MPRVPEYQPSVSLRPAYRQGIDVHATPESFGSDIGKGMQRAAAGLDSLGDAFTQMQALEDETVVRRQRNEYLRQKDVLQYDPEKGYLQKQGHNALDAFPQYMRDLEELRRETASKLSPSQQTMFKKATDPLDVDARRAGLIHKGKALKSFVLEEAQNSAESFKNQALLNFQNQSLWQKYTAAGELEIHTLGEKLGWSPEKLQQTKQNYVSDVVKQTAFRIARTDVLAADTYIKENKQRLTAADSFEITKIIDQPLKRAQAGEIASRILGGTPAAGDTSAEPSSNLEATVLDDGAKATRVTGDSLHQSRQQIGLIGGPAATSTPKPDTRGNYNYMDVARSLVGLNENTNANTVASFIKRNAGIEIDPRTTPWCAAFVNGVLGAGGYKGTGKLNARSFLNFGTATDNPREGDIVVLSRGDPNGAQGHVGFFKGFDENGNVMILGGNQGNSVSVRTFSRGQVLGFRRPSLNGSSEPMPNQTIAGLQHIESEIEKVDPMLRDSVRQQISQSIELKSKLLRAGREQMQENVEKWLIANPNASPDDLPLEVRQGLGVAGMTTLYKWRETVTSQGEPDTDQKLLYDLQTQYADDPQMFGQMDIFRFRDRLSNADWRKVNEWRQTARTDQRKAREESLNLKEAFTLAKTQMEAVGLTTVGKKGTQFEAANQRIAQFQSALTTQMEAFKRDNKKNPTPVEIQSMVNRLLLPVVISTTGWWRTKWDDVFDYLLADDVVKKADRTKKPDWGTNEWKPTMKLSGTDFWGQDVERQADRTFMFDAIGKTTRQANSFVEPDVRYEDIPTDVRLAIAKDIRRELGWSPEYQNVFGLRVKVLERYKEYLMSKVKAE